ncbi:hypothetical protein [Aliiroseovarius sp. S253]|uniref:hypothetical protein n=1 Tax=Aliiroseovarius sp. S253 TaxID=3415133 RepID=UPI003C7AA016
MKPMFKSLPVVAAIATLAACNSTDGIQKENYPQPVAESSISFRTAPGFNQDRIESVEKKTFRTFLKVDDSTVREIQGAKCQLRSSELSVQFVTPAHVNIPLVQDKPQPLRLTCQKGNWSSDQTLTPFIPQETAGAPYAGGGVAGILVGVAVDAALTGAVNAARNSKDVWRFVPRAKNELPIQLK